jgi:hypothetical protein
VGMRRIGSKQRATQRAKSRARNLPRKARERRARDSRMFAVIKSGHLPYAPWVMSWLNEKLDKPSNAITQTDVDTLAHAAPQAV